MMSKPTIILVNDTDHLRFSHASIVFGILNAYQIPFTHATFYNLSAHDDYPDHPKSLAKHCRPGETAGFTDADGAAYISLLKHQIELGNEIAYHGYSQISNTREEFVEGVNKINSTLDIQMSTYIEHGGSPHLHPHAGCKNETLAMDGSNEESKHYVKDLISENFKQAWCYFDLVNTRNNLGHRELIASLSEPTFYKRDGITMMKRYRAKDVVALVNDNKIPDNAVIIAYTHFGYGGYPKGTLLESWFTVQDVQRNCMFLDGLRQKGYKLSTIQQFLLDNPT
jgi:hypothetical protein